MHVFLTALNMERDSKLACLRVQCIDCNYSFCVLKILSLNNNSRIIISFMSVYFSHYNIREIKANFFFMIYLSLNLV